MNEKMKGFFIALEGIDGSGKSTQARLLAKKLAEKGYEIYETSEPTDGIVGQLIRRILKKDIELSPEALSLLFVADRIEHAKDIKSALEEGKIVVSDRYLLSTLAYQGAQGVDIEFLEQLHANLPKPDLTIILDIEPEKALARSKADEKFEKLEFLSKVRQKYLELAGVDKNIFVANTDQPVEKIGEEILDEASRRILPVK